MPNDDTPITHVRKPVYATVCHRVLTEGVDWYPHAEYRGRTIYFCTEFCLEAFLADPERFYIAHSLRKDLRK
jgi:YHS domain-containing protein